MLSLPIQRFLYISSATMLILSTHAARAAQPHETVAIDVSMFAVSASTSAESSPIHPKCDQAVLAESLAITAAPSVCAGDNGIQMLPPEPVATAPRPDLVAAATTPTDTPATHPNSDESPPDIVVSADPHASKIDPLKAANVQSFEAAQAADAAVLRPIAMAYKHVLPEPVRDGLHNFLGNIHEPVVALNYLFQLKPARVVKTVARFALNSTIGVAGLFDFAKKRPFKLCYHPNGFANTLGFYGVKPGPFLYLPLIGPTTPRDLLGDIIDRSVIPLTLGKVPVAEFLGRAPYGTSSTIIRVLDRRIQFDDTLRTLKEKNTSLYVARRRLYFQERQTEIDNLHHPVKDD